MKFCVMIIHKVILMGIAIVTYCSVLITKIQLSDATPENNVGTDRPISFFGKSFFLHAGCAGCEVGG